MVEIFIMHSIPYHLSFPIRFSFLKLLNFLLNISISRLPKPPQPKKNHRLFRQGLYIHPYCSNRGRQCVHKLQKAKKTVHETVHDRLFDIFIPFPSIQTSPIPRKITTLRRFPPYSPASQPGRLHGTNVAKITGAEQTLLCPKRLCTNVAIQKARSKHSHTPAADIRKTQLPCQNYVENMHVPE